MSTQYCNECGTEHERMTTTTFYKRTLEMRKRETWDDAELAKDWCPRCKEYTSAATVGTFDVVPTPHKSTGGGV